MFFLCSESTALISRSVQSWSSAYDLRATKNTSLVEQRLHEKPREPVQSTLEGIGSHVKVVHCRSHSGISIRVTAMRGQVDRIGILIRVLHISFEQYHHFGQLTFFVPMNSKCSLSSAPPRCGLHRDSPEMRTTRQILRIG